MTPCGCWMMASLFREVHLWRKQELARRLRKASPLGHFGPFGPSLSRQLRQPGAPLPPGALLGNHRSCLLQRLRRINAIVLRPSQVSNGPRTKETIMPIAAPTHLRAESTLWGHCSGARTKAPRDAPIPMKKTTVSSARQSVFRRLALASGTGGFEAVVSFSCSFIASHASPVPSEIIISAVPVRKHTRRVVETV
jgi:hypothetical protein